MQRFLALGLILLAACSDVDPERRPGFGACADPAVVPLDSVPDRFLDADFAFLTPKALGDSLGALDHTIVVDSRNRLHCFWTRGWGWDNGRSLGHASSSDLIEWTLHDAVDFDAEGVDRIWAPHAFFEDGAWQMYFTGVELDADPTRHRQRIFVTTSTDLLDWSAPRLALEPRHPDLAWGLDQPHAHDGRDPMVFRSRGRLFMLLTVRLAEGTPSLALAERVEGEWSIVEVLDSIRGHAIESAFLYEIDGQPRILLNNWKEGGQALWTARSSSGEWALDRADLRGFAWELLRLDSGHFMASRVWGSSVLMTRIDLEDLSAVNMVFPDCYEGAAPLLPARTPVWEVDVAMPPARD